METISKRARSNIKGHPQSRKDEEQKNKKSRFKGKALKKDQTQITQFDKSPNKNGGNPGEQSNSDSTSMIRESYENSTLKETPQTNQSPEVIDPLKLRCEAMYDPEKRSLLKKMLLESNSIVPMEISHITIEQQSEYRF